MKKFSTIICEKKKKSLWITLNRPDNLNVLNAQMREELRSVLEDTWDNEEVNIVIITGSGERSFSAGADITDFLKLSSVVMRNHNDYQSILKLIREMPKPVIAVVNGLALGGGCELAMACDIVIAAENAVFSQPEIKIGLMPGGGATQLLPRYIGEKKAKEFIFTGKSISAIEAEKIGLINKVVPFAQLQETTINLVTELLERSPIILRLAKAAINKSMEVGISQGLSYENELFSLCFCTYDQKEGARAFLEKRRPIFKGK